MRAAFIDRDGVINEERDYVYRVEDFHLLPGAAAGLRLLQQQGWRLVVVTNQAGIARGLYTEADFERITMHMRAVLAADGVTIDAVYTARTTRRPVSARTGGLRNAASPGPACCSRRRPIWAWRSPNR